MVSELGYEESRKFNINRFLVVREAPRQTPQSVRFAERLGGFAERTAGVPIQVVSPI